MLDFSRDDRVLPRISGEREIVFGEIFLGFFRIDAASIVMHSGVALEIKQSMPIAGSPLVMVTVSDAG